MAKIPLEKIALVILGFFVIWNLIFIDWYILKGKGGTKIQENGSPAASQQQPEAKTPTIVTQESKETTGEVNLETLEASISAVNKKVAEVEKKIPLSTTTTTTQSTGAKVTYLPIGVSGASTSLTDFETVTAGQEIYLDPADFPGYKNMRLQAYIKVLSGNGKTLARLYNPTDGLAILDSEISTTNENFTLVESGTFRLPSGKKLYKIQLKSLTGYEASVQLARIKVEF